MEPESARSNALPAKTRLCMLPAALPFEMDDERRKVLERIVSRRLETATTAVVGSDRVKPLLEEVDARSGAIIDSATGRTDPERHEKYLADLEQTMREALDCDGFVQPSLHQVLAWYNGRSAYWDGHGAQVNSNARIAGRVALAALGGVYLSETGWVPALSLAIEVSDLRFRSIAFRTAGLEPLMNFSNRRDQDLVPDDRWLRNEAEIERAVASALGDDLEALKTRGMPTGVERGVEFRWR